MARCRSWSVGRVPKWADSGRLSCIRTLGNQRRYREDAILECASASGRGWSNARRSALGCSPVYVRLSLSWAICVRSRPQTSSQSSKTVGSAIE